MASRQGGPEAVLQHGCSSLAPTRTFDSESYMKNQYFGDINDYKKYGFLRILSNRGEIKTAVCWMLTEDDIRNDGKFTGYLDKADKWKAFDPLLFESLRQCSRKPINRSVGWTETENILPSAVFYPKLLTDNAAEREQYIDEFLRLASGCDLVFFDPDNGLEVQSKPYGSKNSCKYLYWKELQCTFSAGHSVLVYQHFRRERHSDFANTLAEQVCRRIGVSEVISFHTTRVLFLLIPQRTRLNYFRRRRKQVAEVWDPQIQVGSHRVRAPG